MKGVVKGDYSATEKAFCKSFAERFKGRRLTKTAFHFFNWAYGYKYGNCRDEQLAKFKEYCRRTGARATWRNAVEWFATGYVTGGGK